MSHAEHASRKKCFVTLSPFPEGQKWKCTFAFAFECSTVLKWKETLMSALGRFDRLHGSGEKRTGWKWRPSPYFTIDSRWGRLLRRWCGIATKIIDFLLQLILQQPLLSLLTITVRGHWIWEGGQLMVTSVPPKCTTVSCVSSCSCPIWGLKIDGGPFHRLLATKWERDFNAITGWRGQ